MLSFTKAWKREKGAETNNLRIIFFLTPGSDPEYAEDGDGAHLDDLEAEDVFDGDGSFELAYVYGSQPSDSGPTRAWREMRTGDGDLIGDREFSVSLESPNEVGDEYVATFEDGEIAKVPGLIFGDFKAAEGTRAEVARKRTSTPHALKGCTRYQTKKRNPIGFLLCEMSRAFKVVAWSVYGRGFSNVWHGHCLVNGFCPQPLSKRCPRHPNECVVWPLRGRGCCRKPSAKRCPRHPNENCRPCTDHATLSASRKTKKPNRI